MKALTIRQPWVYSIFHVGKSIENRTWHTKVRGTIAIHAGAQLDKEVCLAAGLTDEFKEQLVLSAIVGVVDIVDSVENHRSKWFFGPVGFVFENPRLLKQPIPCKGQLGFWNVPEDIEKAIKKELKLK